jgi:glycine betaine/proline transport system ATP-binding protein
MQDEFIRLQNMLHKTIVFITHDFDEAIRLADRIAIMKDGEVIQVDTPEQLVLAPASEYVAEFTKHIPRAKVLTIGSVMTPGEAEGNVAGRIPAAARIEDVADRIESSERPFAVTDGEDRVVGSIGRQTIVDVLVGRSVH